MFIFGIDLEQVKKTKGLISSKFYMKGVGKADVVLGIKISRDNDDIFLS